MPDPRLSQMIFQSTSSGVVSLDGKGTITEINPAASEILGINRQRAIGRPYPELFFQDEVNDAFNQILLDAVYSQADRPPEEVSFLRSDGQKKHLSLAASLLKSPADGSHQGTVLVFNDITKLLELRGQRDELAGELAQKHEELRKAYLDLEERNQGLTERQRRLFWIKILAGGAGICLFAVVAWFVLGGSLGGPVSAVRADKAGPASEENPAVLAKLRKAKVRLGKVETYVSSSGQLQPLDTVAVSARVGGRITEKLVSLGQRVKKGQVLFRLNRDEVLPKVREAKVRFLKAQEQFRLIGDWSKRPESKQAKRALQLAEMELKRKEKRLDESRQLFKEGIIPADDLENATNERVRAQAGLADAQERLSTALAKGSPEKLTVARLEYQNALASYNEAKDKLKHTEVTAPVDGVVMRPRGQGQGKQEEQDLPQQGVKVQESQELLTLGVDRLLGVRAMVEESDIAKVEVGMPVVVSTKAGGGGGMRGVVRSVAPQAKASSGRVSFPVTIVLDSLSEQRRKVIRLGMSAGVRIITAQAENAVLLPVVAVVRRGGEACVRLKKGKGFVWRKVSLGISSAEYVQVKKGLAAGEEVFF